MSDSVEEAYDETDFEMVASGKNLELPTSKPVVFEYSNDGVVTDVSTARSAIERGDYTLISPHTKTGDDDQFYLSSKVLSSETNKFFHVKMNSTGVRVFPKDGEFSLKTLVLFVDQVENELGVQLVHTPDE